MTKPDSVKPAGTAPTDSVSVPREPTEAMVAAAVKHEWSGGFDRQGSHASGQYEEYTLGLTAAFGTYGAGPAAIEIYKAMLAAAPSAAAWVSKERALIEICPDGQKCGCVTTGCWGECQRFSKKSFPSNAALKSDAAIAALKGK